MCNVLLSTVHCPSHQLLFHRFQAYVSFEDLRDPIGCAFRVFSLNQRAIGIETITMQIACLWKDRKKSVLPYGFIAVSEDDAALDHILQFADVSRPRVAETQLQSLV